MKWIVPGLNLIILFVLRCIPKRDLRFSVRDFIIFSPLLERPTCILDKSISVDHVALYLPSIMEEIGREFERVPEERQWTGNDLNVYWTLRESYKITEELVS